MKKDIVKVISEIGFVPLVVLEDVKDAVPLAQALVKGGIPIAEVTFRTAAAADVIRAMAEHVPDVIVGAGTVHNVEQAQLAIECGAAFIVTPGFNPAVIEYCLAHQVPIMPGTVSPADLEQALAYGLTACKFFPAAAYGGVKTLKALAGPYKEISFMPTGGVNADNMNDYLALPNVLAVGGSFMVPDQLIAAGKWDELSDLCQSILARHLNFSIAHVGINTKDAGEAAGLADQFCSLFAQDKTETDGAFFAGDMIEIVKGRFLGSNGHIAVNTDDVPRAAAYFASRNVKLNPDTKVYDGAGHLKSVYFTEEIGGFAVHLRKK